MKIMHVNMNMFTENVFLKNSDDAKESPDTFDELKCNNKLHVSIG